MTVLQSSCCWLATSRTIISRCQRVRNGILGSVAGDYIDLKGRLEKRAEGAGKRDGIRTGNAWEHVHHYGENSRRLKKRPFSGARASLWRVFGPTEKTSNARVGDFWVTSRAIIATFCGG